MAFLVACQREVGEIDGDCTNDSSSSGSTWAEETPGADLDDIIGELGVLEGANGKEICQFFQRGACTRKEKCRFAHVCWRCHKLGHDILECPMPPQSK